MGRFSGTAVIERVYDDCKKFIVMKNLIYTSDDGRMFVMKKGWITDGASFPSRLLGCPYAGCYIEPALLHDMLYNSQIVTRSEADALMLEAMRSNGVGWYTRTKIYIGIRSGGWTAWNKVAETRRMYFKGFVSVVEKLA